MTLSDTDVLILGAQICNFACLTFLFWHLGGPWDDPAALGSTRKNTFFRVQFFSVYNGFQVPTLKDYELMHPGDAGHPSDGCALDAWSDGGDGSGGHDSQDLTTDAAESGKSSGIA